MSKLLGILLLLAGLSSCEKGIQFKLDGSSSQLVVDGSIENGQPPIVVLSSSLDYFSKISPAILENSFVHDAIVTVTDGINSETLKEYARPVDSSGTQVFFYSVDSTDPAKIFYGKFKTKYTLNITTGGKSYSAQTSITSPRKTLDSLWWMTAPNTPDSSKIVLMARITDPPGYGDYIRYYTSVDNGLYFAGLNSVYDDQITDGTTYDIQIEKGVDRNQTIDINNYSFFARGDTVTVKFSNIDKYTFDFWRTMEYNYQSIGNPFSSPTQVLGNISNGALGYFGGYASEYFRINIPK